MIWLLEDYCREKRLYCYRMSLQDLIREIGGVSIKELDSDLKTS